MIMHTIRTATRQTKRPTAPRGKWDRWTDRFSLYAFWLLFGGIMLANSAPTIAQLAFNGGMISLLLFLGMRR